MARRLRDLDDTTAEFRAIVEAASAGIVLGARVPIVLTSRADSRESRIASCAIATLLAHRYRVLPP
jgi:phosphotransacetylase